MIKISYFLGSLRLLIHIILVAILGYEVTTIGLTFNRVRPLIKIDSMTAIKTNVPITALSTTFDPTPLLTAHFFGQATKEVTTAATTDSPPQTPLDLKLQGIYYNKADPHSSYAVITNPEGKTKVYRQGETIDSEQQAVIHTIELKHVVLMRNQRQEIIRFPEPPTKSAHTNNSTSATMPTTTRSESNAIESAEQTTQLSPEQLLAHYQQQLQTDPTVLTQLVRINPVNDGDRLMGYRLRPGQDATLMAKLGLQTGDIVTMINGVALDSPMKALGLVQQLATTEQLNVQLLRNGQSETLSFHIRK